MASSVKSSVTPSVAISATYCLMRLASGSVRMRRKSSRVSALQLDADRQPALQLRQEVRRLGDVERARRDEEHVVGLHRPVLGRDGRALDERQEIALHALARDVGAERAPSPREQILSISSRKTMPLFSTARIASLVIWSVSMQLVALLGDQELVAVLDRHPARLRCARP